MTVNESAPDAFAFREYFGLSQFKVGHGHPVTEARGAANILPWTGQPHSKDFNTVGLEKFCPPQWVETLFKSWDSVGLYPRDISYSMHGVSQHPAPILPNAQIPPWVQYMIPLYLVPKPETWP